MDGTEITRDVRSEIESGEKDDAGAAAADTAPEEAAASFDAPSAEAQADGEQYGLPADHPGMGELRERIEERKKENRKKNRSFRTRFYIITILIILVISGFIFSLSSFFTVDSIEVSGNSHYTAEEIIAMSHAVPGRNIIYSANTKDAVEYLEKNPYIKEAEVTRKFPSTLVIKVSERTEMMAFRYDDDYLIMDGEGVLLRKSRNEPKVTLIEGIVVNRIKLGEKIGTSDRDRFKKTLSVVNAMSSADLYFVKTDMSDLKKVKAYIYDNLVVKADYDTLIENMQNGRLHLVVERLLSEGIRRGTITFDDDGSASFMPVI